VSDDKKPAAPEVGKPPPGAVPPPAPPAKAPPKNPGMVTFTVDGKEVVAKPGTNMVDAVKTVGVEIPYYCYHPRLSIAANCRMCLVEASNSPKLIPACQTAISEGTAIKTTTAKVKESQRSVMEFLLLNHPVDCAICDQAGECKLQDYYMRHDHKPSRLERMGGEGSSGQKVLRAKRKILGPTVVLDQERCILCTRCVRFMDEVAKEPQLGVFARGSHEVIDVHPKYGALDNQYSGNVVDICPVGALLNRDFRFRARVWFLSAAPSICTGCSRGCSTSADYMGQDVYRWRPRENEQINKSWMCDPGRLTYKSFHHSRLLMPVIGKGAEAREATNVEAVKYAAMKLKGYLGTISEPNDGRAAAAKASHEIAFAVAPTVSNEDLLGSFAFARDVLKAKAVYVTGRPMGQGDDFLITPDKNPNRKGLEWIARGFGFELKSFEDLTASLDKNALKALYMVGGDVPEGAEAFSKRLGGVELLVTAAMHESPITAAAHVQLPCASHVEDEGTFTQVAGITQRVRRAFPPRGEAWPTWKWASELGKEMGGAAAYGSSREVFLALAPLVAELKDYAWDKMTPMNLKGQGISTIPASADGRPPGWREQGVPRIRGI
jgi:NADH-quinone oxidoreductase subunit G